MAWVPTVTISGGLYGGRTYPDGDLTGFINFMPQKGVQNRMLLGQKLSADGTEWNGKFGISGDLIVDWWETHLDGTVREFDLVILDVENPEGAQFYKQQLVITCKTKANAAVRRTATIGGVAYEAYTTDIEFGIQQIKRYEYATPYSTPTVYTFMNNYRGSAWRYKISGDDEAATGNGVQLRKNALIIPISYGSYEGKNYFCVGWYVKGRINTAGMVAGVDVEYLDEKFGEFELDEKEDPNEEDPPEDGPGKGGGGGGEGEHNLPNEPVLIPPLPEIGVASVNWLTVYKMTLNQVNSFGQAMLDPTGWDALKQFFNNPLEAIVNLILVPASAPTAGARTPVVGRGAVSYSWPEAYPIIHEEFAEIDCGVIMVKPYWDSAFDFDPYTRIEIFLPFIGFKQIKADDVMGSRVQVKYHVNVMTGEFTAFVSRTAAASDIYGIMAEQVIGEYNGNMGMRVPIGRNSSDAAIDASMRLMSNALGITAGAALGAALGDPMNVSASQAGSQIASATMTAVTGPKNHIERSGALGGGSGYLGNMKPFIVRSIPRQFMPKNYRMLEGYPANIGGTLNHYTGTGYQAVESIQLDGLNAYDSEINEITSLLKGGVLV